jgi:hypothetical protein
MSQEKYACDLLQHANMCPCKLVSNLLASNENNSAYVGRPLGVGTQIKIVRSIRVLLEFFNI